MARVGAPFGIKGWLKLQSFTQTPDSLDAYASWLPPNKASLAFAISFILLWLFLLWLLYRKNIIIKI